MIVFDPRLGHLRRRATGRCSRRRPGHRRGRAGLVSARPASASPRCSASSPGWCRGSAAGAAGRRAARRRSARRTRRASGPTSSGTSARTRPPASSPTPSRRSSPTAMEQLGLPPDTMRRRVEETLDLLGIADLRGRDLRGLSGGEQQRVAIGSVLTMHPRVLVLDEPTSALDPTAAEDVLADADPAGPRPRRLRAARRAPARAGGAVRRPGRATCRGGGASSADARGVLADSPVAPPIVELGRPPAGPAAADACATPAGRPARCASACRSPRPRVDEPRQPAALAGRAGRSVVVRYGDLVAVRGVDLDCAPARSSR